MESLCCWVVILIALLVLYVFARGDSRRAPAAAHAHVPYPWYTQRNPPYYSSFHRRNFMDDRALQMAGRATPAPNMTAPMWGSQRSST